jgi:hypothetical protein
MRTIPCSSFLVPRQERPTLLVTGGAGWRSLSEIDAACVLACRTIDGHVWGFALTASRDGARGTPNEITDGPVRGRLDVHLAGDRLLVEGLLQVYEPLVWLAPLMVNLRARGGWLLLPGRDVPLDLADRRAVSGGHAIPTGHGGAFAWRSQEGMLVRDCGGSRLFDAVWTERTGELQWRAGLVWTGLSAGQDFAVAVDRREVPFLSNHRLGEFSSRPSASQQSSWGILPRTGHSQGIDRTPELSNKHHGQDAHATLRESPGIGSVNANVGGMPLAVRVRELPAGPQRRTCGREVCMDVEKAGDGWRIRVCVKRGADAWRPLRLEAELHTPAGNPSWDGPATVVVPGNFARTNYHPDHVHGGGPKYGPDVFPREREAHTANDDAPGRAQGWTFAASRLPQVWAFAGDAEQQRGVWIGTAPRSPLGETCAGFVSPPGEKTRLKLATPTTYEPWVPLGYSRMQPEARRDHALPPEDAEEVVWEFAVRVDDSGDLNAWGAWDQQLYEETRAAEPQPVRPSLEDAAKICAAAIHDRFYDQARGTIVYSTGPQGRQSLVGFTGMAHSALVMLWAGLEFDNEQWATAGRHVLDTVAAMFLAGPEFPWTCLDADGRGEGGTPFRHGSGEPGYVVMCAFDALAEALSRDRAVGHWHDDWERALRRCADAWVKNQSPEGRYPHWGPGFAKDFPEWDYATTNVEAGVMANMVDAWELLGDDKYLDSARRAADVYLQDLVAGRLYGGPGDIHSLVNSEVPMFFLRGFRRLWEATGDEQHREAMIVSAHWRAQFQYAHSWLCDRDSPLYRMGWSGIGGESASACNLHMVAFGCVNVPDYAAVAEATGDEYWQARLRDLAGYATQQFAHFQGDLGFPFAGAGTESWWATDTLWGKGHPHIFTDPGFDLGYMSWVTGWSGYGALSAMSAAKARRIKDEG